MKALGVVLLILFAVYWLLPALLTLATLLCMVGLVAAVLVAWFKFKPE